MSTEYLKLHYGRLNTEELLRLQSTELSEGARAALENELRSRSDVREATEATSASVARAASVFAEELLAPIWRRVLAAVVDYGGAALVLLAINFPAYVFMPKAASDFLGSVSLLMMFSYFFFKDGVGGRSVGKRILEIKVVETSSGEPCSLPRSLIRNAFHALAPIDWIFMGGRRGQRLGDMVAGTNVLNV